MSGYSTFENAWSGADCMCQASQGTGAFGEMDEYGKLFGQGGWLQSVFRPKKYAAFTTSASAGGADALLDQALDNATVSVDDIEFKQTPADITVEDSPNFWQRLFGTKQSRTAGRSARQAGRATKRASRQTQRLVGATVSTSETSRYRILEDGSIQREQLLESGQWQRRAVLPPDSNLAKNIRSQALMQRREAITGGLAAGAQFLPGLLAQFGIGMPGAGAGAGVEGGGEEYLAEASGTPSWLLPAVIGGGALILVTVLVSRKRTPPATSAPPRRRRARWWMAVGAIIGAVVGVVSATASVVKTIGMKRQGALASRIARIQAEEQEAQSRRQGALTRVAQTRISIIQAQAQQAQLLEDAKKAEQRMTYITLGGSLLVLTVIAAKRK
jgi:hypothetical protein